MVEIIHREDWDNLVDRWQEEVGVAYQIPRRSEEKLAFFLKHIDHLKGKNVLEVGCNAGIFGYHISQIAETYTGLEPANLLRDKSKKGPPKTDYFRQAIITKEYMPENSIFVNKKIGDFIENREKYVYNAFVAVYALYHFTNAELDKLCEYIFPECDTIMIQTRHQKRPSKHNKYKLWKPANVDRFFTKLGFKVTHFKPRFTYKYCPFSIQLCQR